MNLDSCPYKVVAVRGTRVFRFRTLKASLTRMDVQGCIALVLPQIMGHVRVCLGQKSGRKKAESARIRNINGGWMHIIMCA